ncbi:hypothetical protein FEM48_Zijuj05G0189200 [Ziziphus jujuba var. spinosa]|uniref:L-type lectin-domain containing receptor kinase IX.1-like n=1 Tax=Ziziphus jujuba var. spinosa TaxID=714518 RepID=A0A978VGJ8_ZIZJJ|nr:hypothetical protein FEM48_Zijuj05G0189200 [Ziziphus jujuba var. spinosa]
MPQYATVGFSAATGAYPQKHEILSWERAQGVVEFEDQEAPLGFEDAMNREFDHNAGPRRYQIALGLASALLYRHEESEQSVIHRDIKSSNIMLDSDFNTKLGDFGLARLMDEDAGVKTTALAGTFGYMASEYISKGKASKASDVYSFGVVALEIACGRKSIQSNSDASLVARVWELYGADRVVDALECLVNVGLWCAHPVHTLRPSIRQALRVLKFEAHFPDLPKNMPPPNYNLVSLEEEPPLPPSAPHSLTFTSINAGC